jgi:large subunit ribosomal protein L4e
MKAKIISKTGAKKAEIELPLQFKEQVRPDLIKRAVLAIQANKRQPYGTDPEAGKKYSSKLSRRRRDYKGAYGIGISRVPRKIMSYRGTRFNWMGATAPNTTGGRQAHPPKAEKIFSKKINKKERRMAIRSAMSASIIKELVIQRGHIVEEYPLIMENDIENMSKTKEVLDLFEKIGLKKEMDRASRKTEKTGRARRRGRLYKKAIGPLIVVSEKCSLMDSASNIPGVDVVSVESLNAELLAPGSDIARLTIYTQKSIERISNEKLFTDNIKKQLKSEKKSLEEKPKNKEEKPKAKKTETKKTEIKQVSKKKVQKKTDKK